MSSNVILCPSHYYKSGVLEAKSFTGSQVKKNDAWVTVVNRLNLGTSWVGGEAQLVELMPYEALSSNPSNTKRRKTKNKLWNLIYT
jgi:hypothetical protein